MRKNQAFFNLSCFITASFFAMVFYATGCGNDDDSSDQSDDSNDAFNADDDSAAAEDDTIGDDTVADDAADDDGEPPPAPCEIRGAWSATVTGTLTGDWIEILIVETMDYDPLYGAYLYEGCAVPEADYTSDMSCTERTFSGESNGYDFRFTDMSADGASWYEGEISQDCANYTGDYIQTFLCCFSIRSPMTAIKF